MTATNWSKLMTSEDRPDATDYTCRCCRAKTAEPEAPLQTLGEVLPFDELEDEERRALRLVEAVDGRNMWVVERGERVRLAAESRDAVGVARDVGRQHFEGDLTAERHIGGTVDLAHSTFAKLVDDAVRTETVDHEDTSSLAAARPRRSSYAIAWHRLRPVTVSAATVSPCRGRAVGSSPRR
jgi:hypothetical protein